MGNKPRKRIEKAGAKGTIKTRTKGLKRRRRGGVTVVKVNDETSRKRN